MRAYPTNAFSDVALMAWVQPQNSKAHVDAAGRAIIAELNDTLEYLHALEVVNNWRSSHSFPLNTFQVTLRKKARTVDEGALVAQRIKRLPSIVHKLERFKGLRLSQLQDIGGCRAVLGNVGQVSELEGIYRRGDLKHRLIKVDDYLQRPQASGYRGIHMIYAYNSDKTEAYNTLKVEIQLRSTLQHAWATAVETVGTFIRQALKSSQGEEQWLRFFALMGSAIAHQEGTPIVYGTPENRRELLRELRHLARALDVFRRLEAYGNALREIEDLADQSAYFILELNPSERALKVLGFDRRSLPAAQAAYLKLENRLTNTPGAEVVLVSVDSVAALRRAYPNYFLDTKLFIGLLRQALSAQQLVLF